jgi:hypothetical protein
LLLLRRILAGFAALDIDSRFAIFLDIHTRVASGAAGASRGDVATDTLHLFEGLLLLRRGTMYPHVCSQMGPLREAFLADHTLMWLLFSVGADVCLEVAAL